VVRVGKFTGTAAVKKEGKLKEVRSRISFACMIIIYVMTKNTQPIITLRKWLTAFHRKKT